MEKSIRLFVHVVECVGVFLFLPCPFLCRIYLEKPKIFLGIEYEWRAGPEL